MKQVCMILDKDWNVKIKTESNTCSNFANNVVKSFYNSTESAL